MLSETKILRTCFLNIFRRSRSRSSSLYKSSKSRSHRSRSKESSSRLKTRDRYKRSRSRSRSKDRYRSKRSRSRSYIREFVSKPKRHSSSSSELSESDKSKKYMKRNKTNKRDGSNMVTVTNKQSSSPDCVIIDNTVLNEINEDKFTPKQFNSSKSKKVPDNIVIDLQKNTIKVPEIEHVEPDSIFHHSVSLHILFWICFY